MNYLPNRKILFILLALVTIAFVACNKNQEGAMNPGSAARQMKTDYIMELYSQVAVLENPEPQQYGQLLIQYCRNYLAGGGEPISEIEDFLEGKYTPRAAGYGFIALTRAEIHSDFAETLRQHMQGTSDEETSQFHHAELVYETGTLWKKEDKNNDDWNRIVELMEEARSIQTTYLYADALLDAYSHLHLRQKYFALAAYRYIDQGEASGISYDDVKAAYRHISSSEESFETEYDQVYERVLEDYQQSVPEYEPFELGTPTFTDGISQKNIVIDFADAESDFYGKKLLVVVFAVDCPYCVEELQILTQIMQQLEDSISIVAVHIVKEDHAEQELLEEMPISRFASRNNIEVPLLLDQGSPIFEHIDIHVTPFTMLFDEHGVFLTRINMQNRANGAEKFIRLLHNYQ